MARNDLSGMQSPWPGEEKALSQGQFLEETETGNSTSQEMVGEGHEPVGACG